MCVKGFLVLVLVLDWTQCFPQGAGAPPAMLHDWFPQKNGVLGLRRGRIRWIQFAQSLLTVTHQPRAGCIHLVLSIGFDFLFITFRLHVFPSLTSSLSISCSAISTSKFSDLVFHDLHTVFHPVIIILLQHMSIPSQPTTNDSCNMLNSYQLSWQRHTAI